MTFAGPLAGVLGAVVRDVQQLPENLPDGIRLDPWMEANRDGWMFAVPGVARYLIKDGTTIEVEAQAGADPASVGLFLHGPARGFLIHQRGEFPLEAVTVAAPQGGAVALAGHSGSGRSTLAAELCRRGWRLIADDITRITYSGGRALAWPSHDSLKLWRDACERFGIPCDELPRVRARMEKFHVRMPPMSQPTVLRTVIRLNEHTEMKWIDIPRDQNFAMLRECTFRRLQMETLGRQTELERIVEQVAAGIRVVVLTGVRKHPNYALAAEIVGKLS